jgi:hypothetical protein
MRVIEIKDLSKMIAYNDSKPVSPYQQIGVWQVGYMVVCDYRQVVEYSNIQVKEEIKLWPQYWIKDYGNGVIEKFIVPSGTTEEIGLWLQNPKHEKTAIILASKFDQLTGLPTVWQESDWHTVERDGKQYKKIVSFAQYFTQDIINQMDAFFETEGEYQVWINSTDIIPTFQVIRDMPDKTIDGVAYQRRADVLGMPEINFKKNKLVLKIAVRHYLDEVEQKQLYQEIELEAANDLEVFPGMGEYDYIIARIRYEDIEDVIVDMIDLRIADGTIDGKLNNHS